MNRTKMLLVLVFALMSLVSAACQPEEEVVPPDFKIFCGQPNAADCQVEVHNGGDRSLQVDLFVYEEKQIVEIDEVFENEGTEQEKFLYFQRQDRRVLMILDTSVQVGEKADFSIQGLQGTGQTLLRGVLTYQYEDDASSAYFYMLTEYATIQLPLADEEAPIYHELSCLGGIIEAQTYIPEGMGRQEIGLYLNNELGEPFAIFVVEEGETIKISTPTPESADLIELDVVGHKNQYTNEAMQETHRYRTYCVPAYTPPTEE